jgi:hypothetical protein
VFQVAERRFQDSQDKEDEKKTSIGEHGVRKQF